MSHFGNSNKCGMTVSQLLLSASFPTALSIYFISACHDDRMGRHVANGQTSQPISRYRQKIITYNHTIPVHNSTDSVEYATGHSIDRHFRFFSWTVW